jgi:glycosyl transferase family 2
MLSELILIAWLTPVLYGSATVLGEIARRRNARKFYTSRRDVERIIFQIPTLGNYETTNRTFAAVRGYNLPVPLECWVIAEESDASVANYDADRVVVVPADFSCNALYKARALEYARRFRLSLAREGGIPTKYLLLQADDDSTPSRPFVEECLHVDADLIIGTITPRVKGFWNTILDYERCIACTTACNLWTNIGLPVWAHGEGLCLSAKVDENIDYSFPTGPKTGKQSSNLVAKKIISSEDMIITHKAALAKYRLYNSSKPVYITPPLSFGDAIKQRRRWEWGHLRIVRYGLLPLRNRLRVGFYETAGLVIYAGATIGLLLRVLGLIGYASSIALLTYTTLVLWFGVRGYSVGRVKGVRHAFAAMAASYVTVTLNFLVHIIGLVKGDPKKFEVIVKA